MSLFGRVRIERAAARDAEHGIEAKEDRLTAALGLSPEENAQGSFRYRAAIARAADTARRDELAEDIRRLEDDRAPLGNATLLTLALVVVWITEFAGALLLMRALNIGTTTRPFAALALTLALVLLTHAAVQASARPTTAPTATPSLEGSTPDAVAVPARRSGFGAIPFLLLFGVLAGAIAFLRIAGFIAEGGPLLPAVAEAIITLAISVGPAFAAVHIAKRRRLAADIASRIRTLRARLAREEREIKDAHAYVRTVDRDERTWRNERARQRALYRTAHQLATADAASAASERGDADYTNASPSGDALPDMTTNDVNRNR